MAEQDFFVGYQPEMPRDLGSYLRPRIAALLGMLERGEEEGVRELLDGVCAQPVLDGIDLALVAGLLLRASSLSEGRAVE